MVACREGGGGGWGCRLTGPANQRPTAPAPPALFLPRVRTLSSPLTFLARALNGATIQVCAKLCEKLGSHGIVKPKAAVRSPTAPLRMNAGMEEEKAPKKTEYIFDAPPLSSRDKAKIEQNKRKEDRKREAQYEMNVAEMEVLRAEMPPVYVNHSNVGGSTIRDIHMQNFSVTVGGRDLVQDQTLTLAFGRHYAGAIPRGT